MNTSRAILAALLLLIPVLGSAQEIRLRIVAKELRLASYCAAHNDSARFGCADTASLTRGAWYCESECPRGTQRPSSNMPSMANSGRRYAAINLNEACDEIVKGARSYQVRLGDAYSYVCVQAH